MKNFISTKATALAVLISASYALPNAALADCGDSDAIPIFTLPVVIYDNGSYCLETSYISEHENAGFAILIDSTVSDVVLDLNYQNIGEINGSTAGLPFFLYYSNAYNTPTDHLNISLKNGMIQGFEDTIALVANSTGATSATIKDLSLVDVGQGLFITGFDSGTITATSVSFAEKTSHLGVSAFDIENSGNIAINDVSIDMHKLKEFGTMISGLAAYGYGLLIDTVSAVSIEGASIYGMPINPDGAQDIGVGMFYTNASVSGVTADNLDIGLQYHLSTGIYRFNTVSNTSQCYFNDTKKYIVKHYANICN